MVSSNASPRGRTPLFWAIHVGNMSAIRVLIRFGADIETTDHTGSTMFIRLATIPSPSESFGLLTILLEEIKFKEMSRDTLIASQGDARFDHQKFTQETEPYIQKLVNIPDRKGRTPLMFAAIYDLTDVARLLMASGAKLETSGSRSHPLFWALQRNSHGYIRLLERLTKMDVVSESGGNILHHIAYLGDHITISLFIQFELCCIDTRVGLNSCTPLEYFDIERPVTRSEDEGTKLRCRELFLQLLESIESKTATVGHDCVSSNPSMITHIVCLEII